MGPSATDSGAHRALFQMTASRAGPKRNRAARAAARRNSAAAQADQADPAVPIAPLPPAKGADFGAGPPLAPAAAGSGK